MIIRPAISQDAGAIAAIANHYISDTLITFTTTRRDPAEVANDLTSRQPAFLVAEVDNAVAGFATYASFRAGPGYRYCREHSIQIAPDACQNGLGRALMTELERIARTQGVRVLIAGISGANPGAIAFHLRLGFDQTGRLPDIGHKNGQWLDLVLMQKRLSPTTPPDFARQPV